MSRKKPHKVKVPKVKVRRTWSRNPAEQVVGNKRGKPPTRRKTTQDALEEYNDLK